MLIGAGEGTGNYIMQNGIIDEVSIYGSALNSNQITAIYEAGNAGKCLPSDCARPPSGLVSWWPGNGNANDVIGGNNGTLSNGVTFAQGEVGEAFSLNAPSSFVAVPASSSLNVGAGPGFTIETWMKPSDVSQEHPIAEWDTPVTTGAHFYISVPPSVGTGPGCLYANLVDTSGTGHYFASAAGLIVTNAFQHVAVTYDKTSGIGTLYLNAVIVAQQSLGSFTPQTTYRLNIGARQDSVAPAQVEYWAGLLDEVSLYGRALTSNEIAAIYNA